MSWQYNDAPMSEIPEGSIGFVYLIVNIKTGRKYIGKKLFWFAKRKKLKGKTKRFKEVSDWLSYYGSNDELKDDVKKLGPDMFHREILYLCKSKSEMNYLEAKEQFIRGVLETDLYYNSWISCRVTKAHLKKK